MDRLISFHPSIVVAVRIEPGRKCFGEVTLRNVMHTMPVAFKLEPDKKGRYMIRPQSGIIPPLGELLVEIVYNLPANSTVPHMYPRCDDSFFLHSVVVPGAASSRNLSHDSVQSDWFTAKKKQVFIDTGLKVVFVGSGVLARLVADGCMDEVREVLEQSDPEWRSADSVDEHGNTLLHLAIEAGRADLVQLLLEFEPDIEATGRTRSPLEAAAARGEALISELLLARGASTGRSEISTGGPIHLAVYGGHTDILKLLLEKGAEVDERNRDGKTALHIAIEERRKDCVKILLNHGARTDLGDGGERETPLHVAASFGDESIVKLLLQKGGNKDIRNRAGKTAYDMAAEHGHVRLLDMLGLGEILLAAARKGDSKAVRRVLECGASINGRDQNGWTALHRASFKGHVDVVRILIEKGIDIGTKDRDGYTALHCATESGHTDVVELLVKKGADVGLRTNKGLTARHIAESLDYTGIKRMLVHGGATKGSAGEMGGALPAFRGKIDGGVGRTTDHELKTNKHVRRKTVRGSLDASMQIAVT
ncbi:hypothetical protein MLD38_007668 [Melastoma candidum]|uniref:Uncharacterized protein n=1 Tax=Melastoma candidum TaxID=119954 RepID=A0ACB9S0D1_9MYRT|nr:hypothetical protein MLD38_007668 [Melastoma candidum]